MIGTEKLGNLPKAIQLRGDGEGHLSPEPGFNCNDGLDANRGETFKSVPHLQQKSRIAT